MTSTFIYAIAGMAAVSTLYGAILIFGRQDGMPRGTRREEPSDAASESGAESKLEVLSRTPVGFGGSLVLVRFEGRRILLGLARGRWTPLADLGRAPSHGQESLSVIDVELNRALHADRLRRGRKGS